MNASNGSSAPDSTLKPQDGENSLFAVPTPDGDALILSPAPPSGPVLSGHAPAVLTPEEYHESEADACHRLFHYMLQVRWRHDTDAEMNALKGAMVLAEGWTQFRQDLL